MLVKLLRVCFFLWPTLGCPATYYVDTTRPDDTGDGLSEAGAKKTIAGVNGLTLVPGDTVKFACGQSWLENTTLAANFSGTPGSPITYTNFKRTSGVACEFSTLPRIVRGVAVTGTWVADGGGVYHSTGQTGTAWSSFHEDWQVLGQATSAALTDGSWFIDDPADILYYKPTSGAPTDHTLHRGSGASIGRSNSGAISYVTFDGLNISGSGFYMAGAPHNNLVFRNNHFNNAKSCLVIQTSSGLDHGPFTIEHNVFDWCYTNVYLQAFNTNGAERTVDTKILYNTVLHSNMFGPVSNPGTPQPDVADRDGFSLQNMHNSEVAYNDISGRADSPCGVTNWTATGSVVHNFVVHDNYIHDTTGGGVCNGGGGPASADVSIYNNLIVNFGGVTGVVPHGCLRLNRDQINPTRSPVFNNTCANGGSNEIGLYLNSLPGNYEIRNNIIYNVPYAVRLNQSTEGTNVLSNNLYYHPSSLKFSQSGVDKTLVEYQALVSPQDSDAATGNPLFTSATDFTPQGHSPAVDTGYATLYTEDYEGNPRYGTPDLGAIEHQPKLQMGVNALDTAGVQLYADGRFRVAATPVGAYLNLSVSPSPTASFSSTAVPSVMSIGSITNGTSKTWAETATGVLTVVHRAAGLTAGAGYSITVNSSTTGVSGTSCYDEVCFADSKGVLSFVYQGDYSAGAKTFLLQPAGAGRKTRSRK